MLAEDLTRLKQELKAILPEEGISTVIKAIKSHLPSDAPKFNAILQLESRLNEANLNRVKGVLSDEQLQVQYNQLRNDLLTFIDDLDITDFSKEAAKKAKTGSILYKVPREMELHQRCKCVVRLAYEEAVIVQDIDLDENTTMKSVRISESMEVAMIDPDGGKNFAISSISSPEQFLEDDDYSEWVFYVKPLTVGSHPIVLKVSVIELIAGKERKKEIVLEEFVTIITEPVPEEEELSFQNAGYSFAFSGIAPGAEADGGGQSKSSSGAKTASVAIKKYSMVLGAFTVVLMASWAMGAFTYFSWQEVLWRDTISGYESFMLKNPDSKYFPLAQQHLTLKRAIENKSEDEILDFIIDNPKSELVKDAISAFKDISNDDLKTRVGKRVIERNNKNKKRSVGTDKPKDENEQTEDSTLDLSLYEPDSALLQQILDSLYANNDQLQNAIEEDTSVVSRENNDTGPLEKTETKPVAVPEDKALKAIGWLQNNMVTIEGGKFRMGCESTEPDCPKSSTPARVVKVNDFKLCKYEVTQNLWSAIMDYNPSFEEVQNCSNCPVEYVSYREVQQFIKRLNRRTGEKYRLPSEAEWEYAARGGANGTTSKYAGSDNLNEVAWFVENSRHKPQPVGKKKPNELGLYDMTGGVKEWCEDTWNPNFQGAPSNAKPWVDRQSHYRIVRGGSWLDDTEYENLQLNYRDMDIDSLRNHITGFRLASDK